MARKKQEEPEKHASMERWLLTYADLITLLMIFFVVMYALSRLDAQKFRSLSNSLRIALGQEAREQDQVGSIAVEEARPPGAHDLDPALHIVLRCSV